MSQALDKQIGEYLSLLHDDEKKSLLSVIKSFLSHRKEEKARMTIEEYNKELDEAETEFKNGDYISNEEMIKQVKKMVRPIAVVWTRRSQQHMRNAYEYISEDSPKNALKVIEDIIETVNKGIINQNYLLINVK